MEWEIDRRIGSMFAVILANWLTQNNIKLWPSQV